MLSPELLPPDPPLLPMQLAVKSVCDEILKFKPLKSQLSFVTLASALNPRDIQARLRRSGVGDLLLKDGDSLSAVETSDYYENLDLYVADARLSAVNLRAWGWEFAKYRANQDNNTHPPFGLLVYPDERDWSCQLDICLWYSNSRHSAAQEISVTSSSMRAEPPGFERNVFAPSYAETGYEGHNGMWRDAKDEQEVADFLQIAQDLLAARNPETPIR